MLHSYSQEYPWTKGQHEGFVRRLAEAWGDRFTVHVEYLDTKRVAYTDAYAELMAAHLAAKYQGFRPDAIYVTDDSAAAFALSHLLRLFPGAPVFFSGVNDYTLKQQLPPSRMTGVFERKEVGPNLEVMRCLAPGTREIVAVGDQSQTYQAIRQEVMNELTRFPDIRARFVASDRIEPLLEALRHGPERFVFLTTLGAMKDTTDRVLTLPETVSGIVHAGSFVVFSMEDVYLYDGVLGGYVTSGTRQGATAAELVLRHLAGTPLADIPPVEASPNEYVFDGRELRRLGLRLPPEIARQAVILHPLPSLYERHRTLTVATLYGLALLFVGAVGVGFLLVLQKNRRISRHEAVNTARLHLIGFAAEHTLDEVIEETLNQAEKLTGSVVGFYHFVDADQATLTLQQWSTRTKAEFCRAVGKGRHYPIAQAGVWTDCLRERKPVIHNDYASLPHRKGLPEGHPSVGRELVVPVMRGARFTAILGVGNKPRDYTEKDVQTVSGLADLAWEIVQHKRAEEAQRASEERLRFALETSRIGAWDLDLLDHTTFRSLEHDRIFGYAELLPQWTYEMFLEHVLPEDRAQVNEKFQRAIATRGDWSFECRIRRVDGQIRWIWAAGRHRSDATGLPRRMAGIVQDITDRKAAEAAAGQALARRERQTEVVAAVAASAELAAGALQELAARLTEAASRALQVERVGVWLFGTDEARLVCLDGYEASTGQHSSGQVLREDQFAAEFAALKAAKYVDAHDPLTDPRTAGYVEGYLKPNRITSMLDAAIRSGGRNLGVLCFEHVARPHHWEDDEITFACQLADQMALAVAHLDREQARRAQKESEEMLLTVMHSVPGIAIQGYRTDGTVLYWNKASELIYGYTRDEAVGKDLAALIIPENLKPLFRQCLATAKQVKVSGEFMPSGELLLRHKDGRPVPVHSTHTAVCGEGRDPVLFCVDVDLSERKRNEEVHARLEAQLRQAQKLEAMGQLAGGVAHDFNNILAALMINLGMLRHEEDVPPAVRESLAEMSPLVQRAAGLTRQLLLFARRSVMQRRVLDLDLLIEDLLKMLVRLIGESISLRYQSSQESLWVDADPGMIEQAITNLVVNARDAMPAGGQIELSARRAAVDAAHVAAHPQARSGAFVCLTVSDTGCGMDEATLRRIFEPFFTTKAAGKGTGLGLATVQGVVEQHAGWVEVESAVGHGSTFRVYLPAAEPPPGQNAPAAVAQPVPGGSETILLVEDEEMVRRSTTTMLQRHGYRVLEARHGEEALDLWQTHSGEVDLLLTDVVMSQGLDGFVLSEHLRRTNPRLRVVLMSGYSTEALSRDSESAPGTRFLQKPFAPLELLRTLRTLLDDRAMAS